MKTYKYDSEIVDLVHSIMNNGTFHAETINESLLYKFMELRGTPLKLDEEAYNRDIEADWIRENPFNIRSETVALTPVEEVTDKVN